MADILIVEDEEVLRLTIARNLRGRGHETRVAESAEQGLAFVADGPPDLILTDQRLPGMTGHELLLEVRKEHPDVPVVILTAHGTIEDAVAAMRDGAADYLRKPVDLGELQLVIDRCLRGKSLRLELEYYRARDVGDAVSEQILGSSRAVEGLRSMIRRVAGLQKDGGLGPTVLLTGETGTGKGLVARAIHRASGRSGAPLIEVNCTAIPEDLLEAELFGYERGAFTGAVAAKPGLLEAAESGTLFFDEIGHMSLSLQAKLLKVIEDRKVRRLGSTRDRDVRCSFITATHMDLEKLVEEGKFREDLYHRIRVVEVTIAPLRERDEDVLLLARHFLRRHAADYGVPEPKLTAAAERALSMHRWPGNIRELSHTLERSVVLGSGESIDAGDLGLRSTRAAPESREGEASASVESQGTVSVGAGSTVAVDFTSGPVSMEQVEREMLLAALARSGGSKTEAGRLLGMSRDTFRYRLAKYES